MTTKETNPLRLIDEALPRFDVREIHEISVHAALDVVYAAIKSVTARDVRLLTPLEVLRVLARLAGQTSAISANLFRSPYRRVHRRRRSARRARGQGNRRRSHRPLLASVGQPASTDPHARGVPGLQRAGLHESSRRLQRLRRADGLPRNNGDARRWNEPRGDASFPPLLAADSTRKRGHTTKLAGCDSPARRPCALAAAALGDVPLSGGCSPHRVGQRCGDYDATSAGCATSLVGFSVRLSRAMEPSER
jgi:hypothetical protein